MNFLSNHGLLWAKIVGRYGNPVTVYCTHFIVELSGMPGDPPDCTTLHCTTLLHYTPLHYTTRRYTTPLHTTRTRHSNTCTTPTRLLFPATLHYTHYTTLHSTTTLPYTTPLHLHDTRILLQPRRFYYSLLHCTTLHGLHAATLRTTRRYTTFHSSLEYTL